MVSRHVRASSPALLRPRHELLRASEEICARKVPETTGVPRHPIRVGTAQRTDFLVVDPFDFEALMRVVPTTVLCKFEYSKLLLNFIKTGGKLKLVWQADGRLPWHGRSYWLSREVLP
jgi:hypothetical protein